MKYLLIGTGRSLDVHLTAELLKAGEEVFCVLPSEVKGKLKIPSVAHSYYWTDISFSDYFTAVHPDTVIFNCSFREDRSAYLLREVLDCSVRFEISNFILISSTEIYGHETESVITERTVPAPDTLEGREAAQAEFSLELLEDRFDSILIARLDTYLDPDTDSKDLLLEDFVAAVSQNEVIQAETDKTIQLLCLTDAARAISLLAVSGLHGIYNVASRIKRSPMEICQALKEHTKSQVVIQPVSGLTERKRYVDSSKLFMDTEWVEMENPLDVIEKVEDAPEVQTTAAKKRSLPETIRQPLEVCILAVIAGGLTMICATNEVFSVIDWPVLYIVLVSLIYGVRYSILASCLCALLHLFSKGINPFGIRDFYLLAGNILVIVQYLGIGMLISYFISTLRGRIGRLKEEKNTLSASLKRIQAINQENIHIKEEYEKQILSAQNSYTALYGQFHQLIQTETMKQLLDTGLKMAQRMFACNGAALWELSPTGRLLRCLGSEGNQPPAQIKHRKQFMRSVNTRDVYEGDPFSDEPAFVIPVSSARGIDLVLLLRDDELNNGTLGKINDMKTFGLMISDIRIMRERVLLMPGQSEIAGTENEKVKSDLFEISSVHLNSYEKKTNDSDLPDESLLFSPNQRKGITVPEAKEGKV